jgi:hypothetical protein
MSHHATARRDAFVVVLVVADIQMQGDVYRAHLLSGIRIGTSKLGMPRGDAHVLAAPRTGLQSAELRRATTPPAASRSVPRSVRWAGSSEAASANLRCGTYLLYLYHLSMDCSLL